MPSHDPPVVALRRERLRWWIDNRCDGSQAKFIAQSGINQGELSGLLRSKSFGEKRAYSLEQAARMPEGFLVAPWTGNRWRLFAGLQDEQRAEGPHPDGAEEQMADDFEPSRNLTPPPPAVSRSEATDGYLRFDLFEGAAGMGAGVANADYPEVIRTVNIAEWEIRRKLGFLPAPGRMKLMTGRGPSMRPKIEDGDVVMIDTWCTYFDGDDYYLINVDGDAQIKKLMKRADGMWVVSSNPEFPEWRIDPQDLTVCGKALIGMGLRRL